ncbi:hypothetical protein [Acaryochloris marina]|uniref:hypothetical protein n=1 Tax=Acaryochloris marina TaxID=155978 RepID=UPI001EE67C1B
MNAREVKAGNSVLVKAANGSWSNYPKALVQDKSLRFPTGLKAARARGRLGGRPSIMDVSTLLMAMRAMSDPRTCAKEIAQKRGMTTVTLYTYVNGDGTAKVAGQRLLDSPTG